MSEGHDVYNGEDVGIVYPKGGSDAGTEAGASGQDSGGGISQGAIIAIIVVVVTVSVIGAASAILFYVAKKREWKVRENIRKSARKVVTALTPRRAEFPRELKDGGPRSKRRGRMDDVPPTPKLRPEDLEKGLSFGSKKGFKKMRFGENDRRGYQ
ncbi:uncharacterized protein DNG_07551 [Cephalotrichum gorgonifer]|uniref:Uncharacterized protein n=1 Tax=Cephalotrichum gorgonifer TaxID=2041049 RepID=A0AAE8N1V6_9PEZI|nr:uncharacterized protein DNG_07551 [Cephalotrichum gorgonifer]